MQADGAKSPAFTEDNPSTAVNVLVSSAPIPQEIGRHGKSVILFVHDSVAFLKA